MITLNTLDTAAAFLPNKKDSHNFCEYLIVSLRE